MGDANLILIQRQQLYDSSMPLFLVHDGSGSVGSYNRLGDFGRDTWAFENLKVQESGIWTGGIQAMAELYCQMIQDVYPQGGIILGGWSIGGLISLEMSHILSKVPNITVVGVVMIESLFPGLLNSQNITVEVQDLCFRSKMSVYERKRVAKLIFEATRVAKSYESAIWTPEISRHDDLNHCKIASDSAALRTADANPPSPLVLVKASDPVPSRQGTVIPTLLGWDQLGDRWITAVYTVQGHHFSIFEEENVGYLTIILREACIILEMSL
ncbi:alpha/beta-hydrolase [Lindgomyces ingoldianus]|uniref:Alpha/beta-hydrolase n=1 Tax=Lindgomyces ingoldianus TaxID=673940 RepID=A0ACB6QPD7_9PLEO|nr:alpha/beta-hydrolase [Lindgomyces ingoldianus]KAF2468735.1 alpha/beta-hydrolase [Lindgomyces ingoldianus]